MTKLLQSPAALRVTWAVAGAASRVSSRVAGRAAARLWFTPWPVPVSERALVKQNAWLQDAAPVAFTTRSGHRLSGFSSGEGPVVLLVHGWGEWATNLGAFVAPLRDAGYRVVGFDLPAHGSSSGVQTDGLLNAAAVREAAEAVGGVHGVIGHSMGAHATTLALHDGLEADRVVLLAPAVRLEHGVDAFKQTFGLTDRAVRGLRATIESRYGKTVWGDLAADKLARAVTTPALIIHDADDDQIALADGKMLARSWPGAILETTEGLGHGRIIRDPGVVGRACSFLTGETERALASTTAEVLSSV